eukprot:CAMPEP_0197600744 /NCGR_PEP_ID=MMETSP1326-20131121/33892_1 /TAXON_ID=1155430 /ORGANISM="Genus nov. species nov., Strain RCC2288" /LENGTH=186 /DNA_ID=CAMNT_0043167875 /DNA_START=133 /DNA_END=690 /DNA_ORIENTATION=-
MPPLGGGGLARLAATGGARGGVAGSSSSGGGGGYPADDERFDDLDALWLLGCVILTKQSTCLVNTVVREPPGDAGPMRVQPLCGMLTALHSLAGDSGSASSYLTLSHFSVGLCEVRDPGFMVAVLAAPGKHRESVCLLAKHIARSFARAGGPVLGAVICADAAEVERRVHEYTVKDELARDARERA